MNKLTVILYLSIMLALWLPGCQSDRQARSREDFFRIAGSDSILAGAEINGTRVYYRFPSPQDMMEQIHRKNLRYNPTLANDPRNASRYLTSYQQTLNLGVYVADLAYITLFGRFSEALNYFEAVQYLSDKLRISGAYDENIFNRIQTNLDNSDSLNIITKEAYNQLVKYLETNEKEATIAIISAGAYIESVYLFTQLAGTAKVDDPMLQKLADQRFAFENLQVFLTGLQGDPQVDQTARLISQFDTVFNHLTQVQDEATTAKMQDGMLVLGGGEKCVLSPSQFDYFKSIAIRVRREITRY